MHGVLLVWVTEQGAAPPEVQASAPWSTVAQASASLCLERQLTPAVDLGLLQETEGGWSMCGHERFPHVLESILLAFSVFALEPEAHCELPSRGSN